MTNHWHTILNLINEGRLRINIISKETGIPANRISSWKAHGTNPKHQDYIILKDWLGKKYPELINQPEAKAVMHQEDIATIILEMSAKINAMQSAVAEILSKVSQQPFEQVAQTIQDAEFAELQALQQRLA